MINENNLQNDLDQYMKAKFMTEEAEEEILNSNIENFAGDIINEHYKESSADFEVIEFIDNKKLINNPLIAQELLKLDSEASKFEVDNIVSTWIDDFNNEKEHDEEIFSFINSALYKFKNEEKYIENKRSTGILKKYKTVIYTSLTAAASILLLIAGYLFFGEQATNQEIFAEYYETYDYIGTEIRNSGNDQSTLLKEASDLYSDRQFQKASEKYKAFIVIDNTYVQAYLYLGVSQMETKQFNEAIISFEEIILKFDEFEIESKWYMALCYLKLDDNKNAKNYLEEVSKLNWIRQKDALRILKEISED